MIKKYYCIVCLEQYQIKENNKFEHAISVCPAEEHTTGHYTKYVDIFIFHKAVYQQNTSQCLKFLEPIYTVKHNQWMRNDSYWNYL